MFLRFDSIGLVAAATQSDTEHDVDDVFVPIDPGYWSLLGVKRLEELVGQIREHLGHQTLRIGGVLLTKVQPTNVARQVERQVREYFGPLNVKVEEAHSRGLSVLDYAPESAGAKAYLALAKEVLFSKTHDNG
ncbi:MAG: hypothetical protein M3552_18000 [Planctomycetota bacterium]|nr:hypothetical protein [Planctomycetota bacterium]